MSVVLGTVWVGRVHLSCSFVQATFIVLSLVIIFYGEIDTTFASVIDSVLFSRNVIID